MIAFLNELIQNPLVVSAACGWILAQGIKLIIEFILTGEFNWKRITGAGGMPSSHSATVCALVVSTGIVYGAGGFELPMSFFFAFIVMYDAMGVRRETGKQSKILNEMIQQWFQKGDQLQSIDPMTQLKEFVGHTPLQVFIGAAIGCIVAVVVCFFMGYL